MLNASIIIRTFNEQKYLPELLKAIAAQSPSVSREVILVDSGSTDKTISIAESFGAKILKISKNEFTFGRSLNRGCATAEGDYLVFISGHCIPCGANWLSDLIAPFNDPKVAVNCGRQVGGSVTKFSEHQIFSKYFPDFETSPEPDFFCNNANAAIRKPLWNENHFDEELTGLEDMDWAKRMLARGFKVHYTPKAVVKHIHEETWNKVKLRYEREAIALQKIMPEIHIDFKDFVRYFFSAVLMDCSKALQQKIFLKKMSEIVLFRFCQYFGSYRGNHEHRKLSKQAKEKYFYPI